MDFKEIPYDVCRRYVNDHDGTVDDEIKSKILGWVRARDFRRLSSCCEHFPQALSMRDQRQFLMQIEALFKKNALYAESEVCEAAAIDSFLRAEKLCRITNRRLDYYFFKRDRLAKVDPDLESWLDRAEAYIRNTLGPFEQFLEKIPELVRLTSGAASTRKRSQSMPYLKISRRPTMTRGAEPYIRAIAKYFGYDKDFKVQYTSHNRVEFVLKTWKTHRTIACEPEGNLPLQLAFDAHAKDQLRKRGIDLSDQVKNQLLARQGSIDGSFATVDMSMASDTEAYNTVAWLFPSDWFRYLSDIRCERTIVNGNVVNYAKFSSMGNGTTFTTETLIFSAACHAVGAKTYSVYGDDIIIDTDKVQPLLRFLRFLGFIPNTDKSYTEGPFRESCGAHWYEGHLVTPFYLRTWDRRKAVLSHNVNGLATVSSGGGSVWDFLKTLVRSEKLPYVPFNEDSMSGVWITPHDAYATKVIRFHRERQIVRYKAYKAKSRTKIARDVRTLFIWHFSKRRSIEEGTGQKSLFPMEKIPLTTMVKDRFIRIREPDADLTVSTQNTISSHKYVRKWVCWRKPAVGTPVHLYWWSDFLLRITS